jgi:hypothetical protein
MFFTMHPKGQYIYIYKYSGRLHEGAQFDLNFVSEIMGILDNVDLILRIYYVPMLKVET